MNEEEKIDTTEIPHGESTADHRHTRFELISISQFGHGRGGLTMRASDRKNGEHGAPVDLTSEMLRSSRHGDLNAALIDVFAKLEDVYASVHDEHAEKVTTAHVRDRVLAAQEADRQRAEADKQRQAAHTERLAHEQAIEVTSKQRAEAERQLADLNTALAAKQKQMDALHAAESEAADTPIVQRASAPPEKLD